MIRLSRIFGPGGDAGEPIPTVAPYIAQRGAATQVVGGSVDRFDAETTVCRRNRQQCRLFDPPDHPRPRTDPRERAPARARRQPYWNARSPSSAAFRTASAKARATGLRISGPVVRRSSAGVWKKRCNPAIPRKLLPASRRPRPYSTTRYIGGRARTGSSREQSAWSATAPLG